MWRKDELAGLIADLDKYSSNGSSGGGTRSRFAEWFNGIAQEEFLSQNAALLSKLKGQAQRLCLILHCLDAALAGNDGMGLVTEDCMRRAFLLADWVTEARHVRDITETLPSQHETVAPQQGETC